MWTLRQYFLNKLKPNIFYDLQDNFFMLDEDNTYVCSVAVYCRVERIADTKLIRALLC
jgi:hypothetical protein